MYSCNCLPISSGSMQHAWGLHAHACRIGIAMRSTFTGSRDMSCLAMRRSSASPTRSVRSLKLRRAATSPQKPSTSPSLGRTSSSPSKRLLQKGRLERVCHDGTSCLMLGVTRRQLVASGHWAYTLHAMSWG